MTPRKQQRYVVRGVLLRLTVPVREALERAGHGVTAVATADVPRYEVVPQGPVEIPGLVMAIIDDRELGWRLEDEPAFPGEGVAYRKDPVSTDAVSVYRKVTP